MRFLQQCLCQQLEINDSAEIIDLNRLSARMEQIALVELCSYSGRKISEVFDLGAVWKRQKRAEFLISGSLLIC